MFAKTFIFLRLGTKETEMLNERTARTQEWKAKATPLQEWIKKKEAKADSLKNVPDDFEAVSVQTNEVQVWSDCVAHLDILLCNFP